MEVTPVRKSLRFNKNMICLDSPPIVCSRPCFELHAFTPSPVKQKHQVITISSSKSKINVKLVAESTESRKRKGKEIMHHSIDSLPHESDFEDDIPILKRIRMKNDRKLTISDNLKNSVDAMGKEGSGLKGVRSRKSKGKKLNQVAKTEKKLSRWRSYVNVKVFDEVTEYLSKFNMLHLFKESPFGYLLDLPPLNVQPQIIRMLVHHQTNNQRDDIFIFNLNGKELKFGLREFRSVTGFKCGPLDDFIHDLNGPSKLIDRYFPTACDRGVRKFDLIRVFKEGLINSEDVFNMMMIYFISTYILSSPPKYSYVPKDHFLLVESGRYATYPWGRSSFFDLRESISSQYSQDPNYVKFFYSRNITVTPLT